MDRHIYRYFILIAAIIGGASSHYTETYSGQIFILPEDEKIQRPLELALPEAKKWCTDNFPKLALGLPRIIEDRDNMFQFIRRAILANRLNNGQTVLVNSIQHTRSDWSWINGRDIGGIIVRPVSQDDEVKPYNYGFLWTESGYSIQASLPTIPRYYICEYENVGICRVIINHKCYRKKHVGSTWLQARNSCLTDDGDLASFETLNGATLKYSVKNLSLVDRKDYWIGIQRSLHHLDEEGSEIKFINWTESHRSDINARCLCLRVSEELRWIECDCENKYPFVCARRDVYATIGGVVSCVIIVVVIIIIIVIVVVIIRRKQRNRLAKTYEAKAITTTDERTTYSDIQEPRVYQDTASYSASNTTYATIQPTTEANEEFQANNIVYAELDLPPKA